MFFKVIIYAWITKYVPGIRDTQNVLISITIILHFHEQCFTIYPDVDIAAALVIP